jgi:hypothetical protein
MFRKLRMPAEAFDVEGTNPTFTFAAAKPRWRGSLAGAHRIRELLPIRLQSAPMPAGMRSGALNPVGQALGPQTPTT